MTEELQSLLERINQDGVGKAEAERERIVGEAEQEAEKIINNARSEAEKVIENARNEADLLVRKGEESLRQASRDTLLSLREQLQKRLSAVVKACLAADSDPEAFTRILTETIAKQLKDNTISEVEIEIPDKDRQIMNDHIFNALGKDLQEHTTLTPLPTIESGFRLRFNDSDVIYDFSDAALTDTITAFLGPRLARIIESAGTAESTEETNDAEEKAESGKSIKDKKPHS